MAHVVPDFVKEVTNGAAEGSTGDYVLEGAAEQGFRTFAAAMSSGDTTWYAAFDGTDFETGLGTFNASGNSLARTEVLQSSNGNNNPVNWGPGVKTVVVAPIGGMFARIAELPNDQTFSGQNTFVQRLRFIVQELAIRLDGPGGGNYNLLVKHDRASTWGSSRAVVFTTGLSRDAPVSEVIVLTQNGMYVGNPSGLALGAGTLNVQGGVAENGQPLTNKYLRRSQNLADLIDPGIARNNLNLGNLATLSTVGSGQIQSGSVRRSELSTTTGTVSVEDNTQTVVLPGGQYGFYPETRSRNPSGSGATLGHTIGRNTVSGGAWAPATLAPGNTDGYDPFISLHSSGSDMFAEARQRYVQSSPPYDLGDGLIHGFIYVTLTPAGEITSLWMAADPPWYGTTDDSPVNQFEAVDEETGAVKVFGRYRRPAVTARQLMDGVITLEQYRAQAGEVAEIDEEITPKTKARGMDKRPHPFGPRDDGEAGPPPRMVMLDPMDELVGQLIAQMEAGDDVIELFHRGYLRVDNERLARRKGPPGVAVHKCRWK